MDYYCFNTSSGDENLNYKMLREVEVYSPRDVGEWLVKTFSDKLDQRNLAEKLKMYFSRRLE